MTQAIRSVTYQCPRCLHVLPVFAERGYPIQARIPSHCPNCEYYIGAKIIYPETQ